MKTLFVLFALLVSASTVSADSSGPIPGMHSGDTITVLRYNGTTSYEDQHGNHTEVLGGTPGLKNYFTQDSHGHMSHGQIYDPSAYKNVVPESTTPVNKYKDDPCTLSTGKRICGW